MLVVTAQSLWWSPFAQPFFRRQRRRIGRPHRGVWQDTGYIGQFQRADAGPQVRVAARSGIHQHHAARKPGSAGRFDLLKRDLWLGLKADLLGHAHFAPTFLICRPFLRQIERYIVGRLAWWLASDSDTATWQLSCLPSCPQY